MTSIRIQCETCGVKLRVRDEGFVGEVHACPRCGSMVLIAGPEPSGEPAPAEPTAVTAVMSQTLEAEPAPQPEPEPTLETPPAPAPPPEVADPPPAPTVRPTHWAPWATTAVALTATAGVLIAWAVTGSDSPRVAVAADPIAEATPEPTAPEPKPEPVVSPEPPVEESTPRPIEPQPIEPAPIDVATPEPITDPVPSDPPTSGPQPSELETIETAAPGPRVAMASRNLVDRVAPEEPREIDPLAFDPNEIELILRHDSTVPSDDPEPTFDAPEIDPEPNTQSPSPDERLDEQLADAGRRGGVYVRRGPTGPETAPSLTPAAERLLEELPGAELRQMPLAEAVRLIGDLAGVSVTIEPSALRRAATTPRRPVDVLADEQALGEVLATTLAPARLEFATDGPHVVLKRSGADRSKSVTHQLDDLADGDAAELDRLLRASLSAIGDARVSGDGSLTLDAELATHFDLVVFCEQLRIARGLPTRSKYPRALVHDQPTLLRLAPVLSRRTTFSFVEPTPLADVVAYWRQATGLSILVDWRALAAEGLGPRSLVECSVIGRPWQAAFDGVLEPLGLSWGPAGGDALCLTTRDAPQRDELVELYAMPEDAAERLMDDRGLENAAYDAASRRLIVRGDAATHRDVWRAVSLGAGL